VYESKQQTQAGCRSLSDIVATCQLHSVTSELLQWPSEAADDDDCCEGMQLLTSSSRQYCTISSTLGITNDFLFCHTHKTTSLPNISLRSVAKRSICYKNICPSICHTRDSCLNVSRLQHMFCTPPQNKASWFYQPLLSGTLEYISTLTPPWVVMSPRLCQAASLCYASSEASVGLSPDQFCNRLSGRWSLRAWTTATHRSPVCPRLFLTDCSLCLTLPHAWFTQPGSTITSLRCWTIYTSCEFLSGLSSSSLCSFTDVCVAQRHLTWLMNCVVCQTCQHDSVSDPHQQQHLTFQ